MGGGFMNIKTLNDLLLLRGGDVSVSQCVSMSSLLISSICPSFNIFLQNSLYSGVEGYLYVCVLF